MAAFAALLAGCAAPSPPLSTWRVEPNYRVSGTGPGVAPGYAALARQYEGERRWRDATEAWRKASLEAPDDVDVLNSLGTAEAGQGRYREGIAALRRAVALAPERAQVLNNLGFALLLDGLTEEAAAVLREALQREPAHRMARANLDRAEQSLLSRAPAAKTGGAGDMPEQARLAALGLATQPALAAVGQRPSLPDSNAPARAALTEAAPTDARVQLVANVVPLRTIDAASAEMTRAEMTRDVLAPREEPPVAAQIAAPAEPTVVLPRVPLPAAPGPVMATATPAALLPKSPTVMRPPALSAEVLRASAATGYAFKPGQVGGLALSALRVGQAVPRIEIANGNGVNGMAARFHGLLRAGGHLQNVVLTNLAAFNAPVSTVYYRPGFATAARALAARSPVRMEVTEAPPGTAAGADIRVVLGHDARLPATCTPRCLVAATPAPMSVAVAAVEPAPPDRADSSSNGVVDTSDPGRPSALVAAWLEVLAR